MDPQEIQTRVRKVNPKNANAVCPTTPSRSETPLTHRNWPPRSNGSRTARAVPPRAVTADRGYGQASVERDLHDLGVRSVAIPRTTKPSAARRQFEHRRAFRHKIKWRTGSEGRINHLKRSLCWNRTELTGIHGARTWCGHGVFAHNLVKISALAA
jgi:IS5 family transposase